MAEQFTELEDVIGVEALEAVRAAAKADYAAIEKEFDGRPLPEGERDRLKYLYDLNKETQSRISELNARRARAQEIAGDERSLESAEAQFRTFPKATIKEQDLYDLSSIRSYGNPGRELRDRAMRAVETATFPHPGVNRARAQEDIAKLIDGGGEFDSPAAREVQRRILITGNPVYKRAFFKHLSGAPLTTAEQNALAEGQMEGRAIGVGSTGFPVVFTLDPTLVRISNFVVNPWRGLARNVQIAGTNEWKAVTSAGITAAYAAEATEASDNSPTLAQPDIIVERAQAYVPFSIEAQEDWAAIQTELAGDIADGKDVLESGAFATGAGHGSNTPKGILTGATNTTVTTTTGAFVVADIYKIFEALPPRYRPNAKFAANLFIVDKVRQFDTSGGSGVWIGPQGLQPLGDAGAAGQTGPIPSIPLLGRGVYEASAMASTLSTGTKILLVGDFRYFVIVDRIGMNIELDPMVLGSNRRPTGQRAIYAYWRNSSDVLTAAAFQTLVT